MNILNSMLFLLLLASGMALPGFLLGRILPTATPLLTTFLGSCLVIFQVILALSMLGLRIDHGSVSIALALVDFALLAIVILRRRKAPKAPAVKSRWPRGAELFWLAAPALGIGAVALRAVVEPLSGFDNVFRWDFLARQILRTGTLDFYPPVTAEDFTRYGWCDGIAPFVSALNVWSYISAGTMTALATAPRVIAEIILLFVTVWKLARQRHADSAWPAVALLATSPLLLWGVAMAQETGLTALTLTGMVLFLREHQSSGARSALIWAGITAGIGGLAREYGLAWTLIGLGMLWHAGTIRRSAAPFLLSAILVAAPWYVRIWLKTGNPLFSHELLGLFPANRVHVELMQTIVELYRVDANLNILWHGLKFLLITSGLVFTTAFLAACLRLRSMLVEVGAICAVVALWYWSISQTAGGWSYAARVLTPALALAAIVGGDLLARIHLSRQVVAAVLAVVACDSAIRSLYLPINGDEKPWRQSLTAWIDLGQALSARANSAVWSTLARVAGKEAIVVDNPAYHAFLTNAGGRAVPLPSPDLDVLYDTDAKFSTVHRTLRDRNIRFLILTPNGPHMDRFSDRLPFVAKLRRDHAPVLSNTRMLVYDLAFVEP